MKIRISMIAALMSVSAFASAQDIAASPNYGTVSLETGFTPDPHVTAVSAGGSVEVSQPGCTGYVSSAPDVDLNYTAGTTFPLNIYAVSEGDTTLLINLPDGTWVCADDTEGFNPGVTFETPQSGLYNIWVGSYSADEMPDASLKISELAPSW